MWYFIVRAISTAGKILLEVDVPLNQLWIIVDEWERQLQAQGLFDRRDRLLKRLVPLYAAPADHGVVKIRRDIPPDLGESEYDIYPHERDNILRPIQWLSFWYCAPEQRRIYSVEVSVDRLFDRPWQRLRERLVRKQVVSEGDPVNYEVFLEGEGPVRASYAPQRTIGLLVTPVDYGESGIEPAARTRARRPTVDVTVTGRESLVELETRSWQDYHAELRGVRQRGDIRILLNNRVVRELNQVANDSVRQDAEVGGFLIGNVFKDENEELFVDVSDIVAAEQATGTFTSLRFNEEAWQQAFEEIRHRFPGKRRVGWYHTHLIGAKRLQPVAEPGPHGRQVYSVVNTTFFSQADVFLHRNFFPEPWHVALVVDLKNGLIIFYQWKQGEIAYCQGYYLYDESWLGQRGGFVEE